MRRALRPGGRLVVEDIDFRGSFCDPESEAFLRYEEIYVETARRNGGDPHIAVRIPSMLSVPASAASSRTSYSRRRWRAR